MTTITHNWAEHVAFGAASTHFPSNVAEVQELVRQSPKVRAVGTRHSFNDLADTKGALVSLRALERRIEIDPASRTVVVDGGITFAELAPVLDAAGWALFNFASIPDFTIAGAVSTATHGSGNANRNLAGFVAALEIVTASGELLTLKRGDADFDGAVVALGALGLVTSLTLDIVPRVMFRQDVYQRLGFDEVAANFDAVMGSGYSVSLFSRWNGDTIDLAWLKNPAGIAPPADLAGGSAGTTELSPVWGHDPTGTTAQLGVPGSPHERLPHARIGVMPATGAEYQSEYFVARSDAPAAMRAIRAIEAALHPLLIVSEIRTVAADALWLSTNFRQDSVGLHFAFRRDWPGVSKALATIEAALAPFTPRPHWGKLFVMQPADVQARYPRLADFRALADRCDPDGKFRNAFLDRYVFDDPR